MSQPSARPALYGAPPSQPTRSVVWACLLKGLAFELRMPDPAIGGLAAIANMNPKRQMPVWQEPTGFALYEMAAILIHLAERHAWHDLLPAELEPRARVHQYLHFHHSTTRLVTMKLMAPHVTIAMREAIEARQDAMDILQIDLLRAALRDPHALENGRAAVDHIAGLIERGYLAPDRDGRSPDFLCGGHPTIADLAAYEDLGQLRPADLHDYAGFPRLRAWLDRMEALPFHDVVHAYNTALGDIRTRPNTLERFARATAAGFDALEAAGLPVTRAWRPEPEEAPTPGRAGGGATA